MEIVKRRKKHFLALLLSLALLVSLCPDISTLVSAQEETGKVYTYQSDNGEVSISLKEVKDNDNWYEYYLSVSNQSAQSVCDWSVVLNCSDVSKYSKAFECSGRTDETAGTITVQGMGNNKVVAAGSTISSSESFKLGFGSPVTFTGGKISYSYGTQSSVEDTAGGVGYGNTYLDDYYCKYNLTGEAKTIDFADTPLGKHGKLHVDGTQLTDEHNQPTLLRGASTHGMHWGEMTPFVNKEAFQNLRDEWGVDMIRLVSYVTQGGYTQGSQSTLDDCIQRGVSYADDLGMYAIIDWHIHAENPNDTKSSAITFFDKYSKLYGDHDNILYEICNEPTGTPWNQLKPYAEEIVKTIRANDPDAIIIVGTNTYSQDVDEVATNGGKLNDQNVMYTIHFYSGTHGQSYRDKVTTALNAGTPIFCTEFGICDASGNGGFNLDEADNWIEYFEQKGISYCCWSLCNKDESASMISPQCNKKSGWVASDLGATGAWLVNTYRSRQGSIPDVTAKPQESPSGSATQKPGNTGDNPNPSEPAGVTILASDLGGDEEYTANDMDWFQNGNDEDIITLIYTCTDSSHNNWGVMEWGASVDGQWVKGPEYKAGSIASNTMTETITLGELKKALGVTSSTTVTGLQLTVYNGGKIIQLKVQDITATAAPGGPDVTNAPGTEPTGGAVPSPTGGTVSPIPITSQTPGGGTNIQPTPSALPNNGGTSQNPSATVSPENPSTGSGTGTTDSSAKKTKLTLKKKVLRIKKGKKARIQIKKKAAGDSVKKYRIVGKKKIVKVTGKGVVRGLRKGKTTVKVVMKSGATAKCKIIVRR